MKENYLACKNAIENVIKKHFDGYHLNKEAVTEILSQYDMDSVSFVLAYTLHSKYWDGRFSKDNKEWGKCYLMHEEVLKECIVDSHPAVLNGFVDLLRQKVEEQEELVYWFPNARKYLYIQTACSGGYDYTFYDEKFKDLDGGVYDNLDTSMMEVIQMLLEEEKISGEKYHQNVEAFLEKVEDAWMK